MRYEPVAFAHCKKLEVGKGLGTIACRVCERSYRDPEGLLVEGPGVPVLNELSQEVLL